MRNKKGFTLVELLIVIGIVTFFGVLVVGFLRSQIFKSNDARRKADLKRIGIAVEEYEKDNNCYPLSSLVICTNGGVGLRPYLDQISCDPVSKTSYLYLPEDSVCPKWYSLYSNLQNELDSSYQAGLGPYASYNYSYSSSNAPKENLANPTSASNPTSIPDPESTPSPSPSPTPVPQVNFFGCFSGVCSPMSWDESRPGPECDPNYQNSTCYQQCADPSNECQPWN